MLREQHVENALEQQPNLGHVAAVQRNGRKLADVLDGAVPGQAIVHFGNHAQVHAVDAGLFENILHELALARRGEENLIHKLLARMLEKRLERADHVAGFRRESGAWYPGKSMNPLNVYPRCRMLSR